MLIVFFLSDFSALRVNYGKKNYETFRLELKYNKLV